MGSPTRIRLLYAEDDADTREMICVALQAEGFEVVCPLSIQEFLKLAKNDWDLYMVDTWMPEMSGFDLCEKIREFNSSTPIIFYSAAALESDKKQALERGAFAYFVKPVPFDELIAGIRAAVKSRQASAGTSTAT